MIKFDLYYFEKSPLIVFNESFIHHLNFIFFAYEIRIMNLKSFHYVLRVFCPMQTLVEWAFL
jgi:hypothetical protein